MYQIVMQKYNKYKKLNEKDQQTMESFDKLYRKSLQGNAIDKNEYESLCIIATSYLNESKIERFLKVWTKNFKLFFSNNKIKFNLEPRS